MTSGGKISSKRDISLATITDEITQLVGEAAKGKTASKRRGKRKKGLRKQLQKRLITALGGQYAESPKKQDPREHLLEHMVDVLGGQYIGSPDQEHCISIKGNVPLLFTVPHAGKPASDLGYTKREFGGRDMLAGEFALTLAHLLDTFYGIKPHVLVNTLDRAYVDLNRSPKETGPNAPFADEQLAPYYDAYHKEITDILGDFTTDGGQGLHIAWHTFRPRAYLPYFERDLYAHKNGLETDFDPNKVVKILSAEAQVQQGYPLVLGTHLRKTIDKQRGIDGKLREFFGHREKEDEEKEQEDMQRGIPVFVPSEKDTLSLLGGKYEILHALDFKDDSQHPIDSLQIEVASHLYMHAFDHLAWNSMKAIKEALKLYTERQR